MKVMMCRLVADDATNTIKAIDSIEETPTPVQDLIKSDRQFGYMPSKNGVTTWSLLNTDVEISFNNAKASIEKSFVAWTLFTSEKFKYVKDFNTAQIQIMFRSQAQDKNLTGRTIAYAWYPYTGLPQIVINTAFLFTQDGVALTGKQVEKLGVKVQFPNGMYVTIDLDKVIMHELGHKKFGLQHDTEYYQVMTGLEPVMALEPTERDVTRANAKCGGKKMDEDRFNVLYPWWQHTKDRKF